MSRPGHRGSLQDCTAFVLCGRNRYLIVGRSHWFMVKVVPFPFARDQAEHTKHGNAP
jgi:hypothetical protein